MGVDHIGVLVGDGSFPREQTIEKAREIFAAIPGGSKTSALSLSHDVGEQTLKRDPVIYAPKAARLSVNNG